MVGTAHKDGSLCVLGEPRQPLRLQFGHQQQALEFRPVVIKDLGMALNISGPFLKEQGIDQLHSEDVLVVHDEKVPLHPPSYQPEEPIRVNIPVILSTTAVVPPFSIRHCLATIAAPLADGTEVLLEGNQRLMQRGIVPWRAAVTTSSNNQVRIGLCNPGAHSIKLKAGARYGTGEPAVLDAPNPRISAVGNKASVASHKPTVQQRLREIVDRLKQPEEDKEENVKLPVTTEEKMAWVRQAFSLNNNTILQKEKLTDQVAALLTEYFDVISVNGEFGHTSLIQHAIHTQDVPPIKCRARPINPWLETDLKRQLDDLKNRKVIEASKSPWSFPMVAAPKKNGKIRWCVDYRKLNDITLKDSYPIPCIEDNLARLSRAKIFSCLDGSGAFHVIDVRPQDRPKTAFSTPWGSFQYRRMPFGLTNGPASYSRLVQLALDGIPPSVAMPYLDDIIVTSTTPQEHVANLTRILQVHRQAGLKLQPSKCQLFREEVEYLGHLVSAHGVKPVPTYLKVIKDWPMPTTKSEVRIFLGKAGYYRRFIKGYSGIAGPLSDVAGKGTPEEEKEVLEETEDMRHAFEELKQRLLTAPILAYPRFDSDEPFVLDTDWSHDANAIGGVLSQKQDGKERVIQYGSKKLSKSQRSYGATKGELTAFLYFAKHWSYYLRHRPFILRTDHHPLKTIRSMQPQTSHTLRMMSACAELEFDVVHRAGTKHNNADALSRAPHVADAPDAQDDVATDEEIVIQSMMLKETEHFEEAETSNHSISDLQQLRSKLPQLQEEDDVLQMLRRALEEEEDPLQQLSQAAVPPDLRTYAAMKDNLLLDEQGILTVRHPTNGRQLLCLPEALWAPAIQLAHEEGGHAGVDATTDRLSRVVYFPRLKAEVSDFLRNCLACQKKRGTIKTQRGILHSTLAGFPFQRLSMDFVGPIHEKGLTSSKNKYIFTVRDTFSKWLEAFPVPSATSASALQSLLTHVFPRFGIPEVLHSDRGTHFTSQIFQQVADRLGIKHTLTPAYNPKSNPVERAHQDLGNILRATMQETGQPWEQLLPQAVFAMNTSVHTSTGISPFRVLFGRDPSTPLHLIYGDPNNRKQYPGAAQFADELQERLSASHQAVRKELQRAVERRRRQYQGNQQIYQPGQLVWLFSPALTPGLSKKLQTFWTGPWTIIQRMNQVVYKIRPDVSWKTKKDQLVSVDRLKPYHAQQEEARANRPPGPEHDLAMNNDPFAERPLPPDVTAAEEEEDDPPPPDPPDSDSDDDDAPDPGAAPVQPPLPHQPPPAPVEGGQAEGEIQQPLAVAGDEHQQEVVAPHIGEQVEEEVLPEPVVLDEEVGGGDGAEALWWDHEGEDLPPPLPTRNQPPRPKAEKPSADEVTPQRDETAPEPPPRLPPRVKPEPRDPAQTPQAAPRWSEHSSRVARRLRFGRASGGQMEQDVDSTVPRGRQLLDAPNRERRMRHELDQAAEAGERLPDTPPFRTKEEDEETEDDKEGVGQSQGARPKRLRKPKREPDFYYY